MSNVNTPAIDYGRLELKYLSLTDEEMEEFNKQSRKMERELSKAAEAGLFLTAADLRDE